jgi:heme exporter protein A
LYSTTNYSIELKDVIKYFGRRLIFHGINFSFSNGNVYGISGPNGSGKSTIVKIIAGLISPTKGKTIHSCKNAVVDPNNLHEHIGFVSPYLVLYDEFSAEENLILSSKIRGIKFEQERSDFLLDEFGLHGRKGDLVRGYSSGMKQRLKFAFALLHQPELVILDEPTSNLDNDGKERVYKMIEREKKERLIIVASNEDTDLSLCGSIINLDQYKSKSAVTR